MKAQHRAGLGDCLDVDSWALTGSVGTFADISNLSQCFIQLRKVAAGLHWLLAAENTCRVTLTA